MRNGQITERRPIAAPVSEVWELLSTPGYLAEGHPFCSGNPVGAWPGEGSTDTIEYYNGRVVERRFVSWEEGVGYDLEASDRSGPSASVSWRVLANGEGSQLTISLLPRFFERSPALVRWLQGIVVRPMMRRYLRTVLRGIEWRVVTGEPVHRNQFGSHPWFSPRV